MSSVSRFVALAIAMSVGGACLAEEKGIPEYEGKMTLQGRTLHYSYVFLPRQAVIIQLVYDNDRDIVGAGHGTYSMGKGNRITIRWQDGGTERGHFYDRSYRITHHTDKRQVGIVTKGGWRNLSAPDRLEWVDRYVRKVVVPMMQRKTSIRRQLQELDARMLQHHIDIMNIWANVGN